MRCKYPSLRRLGAGRVELPHHLQGAGIVEAAEIFVKWLCCRLGLEQPTADTLLCGGALMQQLEKLLHLESQRHCCFWQPAWRIRRSSQVQPAWGATQSRLAHQLRAARCTSIDSPPPTWRHCSKQNPTIGTRTAFADMCRQFFKLHKLFYATHGCSRGQRLSHVRPVAVGKGRASGIWRSRIA